MGSSSFLVPGFGSCNFSSFLDEWPVHFILYSLNPSADGDPRHVERRKTYFCDIMVWSSNMEFPRSPERYDFQDGVSRTASDAAMSRHESEAACPTPASEQTWPGWHVSSWLGAWPP